jgi:hypothetical protein
VSLPWNKSHQVHLGDAVLDQAAPALMAELSGSLGRKASVQLVLADTHFHFDLVHGDYRSSSDRHLQAIASACVAEILGDDNVDRLVRWCLQPDRQHLLICAMASKDIALLDESAAHHTLCLRSLQSEFCTQWNAHANALPDGSGVFAVASASHVVLALVQRGSITALSSGAWPDNNALDVRADQLLSGVGMDSRVHSVFVLVVDPGMEDRASQRWSVVSATRGQT